MQLLARPGKKRWLSLLHAVAVADAGVAGYEDVAGAPVHAAAFAAVPCSCAFAPVALLPPDVFAASAALAVAVAAARLLKAVFASALRLVVAHVEGVAA